MTSIVDTAALRGGVMDRQGEGENAMRWRTQDGKRSPGGDDYCLAHGEFRCPECDALDQEDEAYEIWLQETYIK